MIAIMPVLKSVLVCTLLAAVGAFAAECDENHVDQACQALVLGVDLGPIATASYTEGRCIQVVVYDDSGSTLKFKVSTCIFPRSRPQCNCRESDQCEPALARFYVAGRYTDSAILQYAYVCVATGGLI
jgi:hypothetical protein